MTQEIINEPFVINPLLGSDPEVFIYATDFSSVVSSLDLVGGTKDSPKPLKDTGFFVQEDNVLAEYNIPASKTKEEFVFNIKHGLDLIKEILPQGFIPLIKSSHRFSPDQLEDPRAFIMGCDPDYNAWTGKKNVAPDLEKDPYLRSAGGHIHIGYDNPSYETNKVLVRMLDAVVGIPSIILDKDMDRRKLYGKAGAYRDKAYGVEYRTLSSFWVENDTLTGWVFDQVHDGIRRLNTGDLSVFEHEAVIQHIINDADVSTANSFIKKYGINLPG